MAPLSYIKWLVQIVMNITDYEKLRESYRRLCEVANKELLLIMSQVTDDMEDMRVESLDNFDLLILNLNVSSLAHILENIVDHRKELMSHEEERIYPEKSSD